MSNEWETILMLYILGFIQAYTFWGEEGWPKSRGNVMLLSIFWPLTATFMLVANLIHFLMEG